MEFHEAAEFLFDLQRYAPRPGLDPTRDLLAHLSDPQDEYACVQVAGSNGKGSTARMVERALREAGLSVGLYTSPHLNDVRERVRVDGRKIPKVAVADFVAEMREYATDRAVEGTSPTFFEALTALALWEFDRQGVDVAVLEVGIGGSLDATSVVDPVASGLTSVTLEHTEILGETTAEIARDMAGVAPADAPLVTAAEGEALAAVRDEVADVRTVGSVEADRAADVTVEYGGRNGLEGVVDVDDPDWTVQTRLPLLGAHQARNAGVAATLVYRVLETVAGDPLPSEERRQAVERGLRNAHWPGRFEVLGREPLVVLDGAHNPGGCEALVETLGTFEYDELTVVTGAMTDKDHRGVAAALDEADLTRVIATRPDHDRAEDETVIARAFRAETDVTVETVTHVAGALDAALADARPDDAVVVTGSLYAVAEARDRRARTVVPADVDSLSDARQTLERADVVASAAEALEASGVHRVVRTRVRPRQAGRLREAALAAGAECAVSAVRDGNREPVDVVLMGTLAQFERLWKRLADGSDGQTPTADDLRARLDRERDPLAGAHERSYPWADGTAVMGILNVTPDSFHDGGEYDTVEAAYERAERMVEAGVDVLDVGGESTRPGAEPVAVEEERARVVPVVEALSDLDVMVSVDTRKAAVARAALDAGADLLNDVSGLEDPAMRLVAADHDVPVVVMHSIETPVDPDTDVQYDDVVTDVIEDLTERVLLAEKAGLDRSQILVDPGLGFGKSASESFELLDRLDELRALGCPVLVGHSHKSMFELAGAEAGDALDHTVAATALAADRGADVIRVHDAAENVAAVRVAKAADDPSSLSGE